MISFPVVFSGLIGAIIGVASAWSIAWWHQRQVASVHLRRMLFGIGKDLYHANADPYSILDPTYLDLMDALWGYHRFCSPWRRKAFLSAGYALIGHDTKSLHRHCHAYPDRQEAYNLTEKLLGFVGCPYDTYTPKSIPEE